MITVEGVNCLAMREPKIESVYCPEIDKKIPRSSCEQRQGDPNQKICFGGCKSKGKKRKAHIGFSRFTKEQSLELGLKWLKDNTKGTPKIHIAEKSNVSEATVHRFINMAKDFINQS